MLQYNENYHLIIAVVLSWSQTQFQQSGRDLQNVFAITWVQYNRESKGLNNYNRLLQYVCYKRMFIATEFVLAEFELISK